MERKGQDNQTASETAPTAKRSYKTPRLRRLGSVRELTLGQTMGIWPDGGVGMMINQT